MNAMSRKMRKATLGTLLLAVVALPACYHVTVDTGRRPSGDRIEQPWAHSFIGGLVPPSTVETAQRCPNGVARVESQLSFMNLVVGVITGGIYTPMTITVACAAPGTAMGDAPAERVITLREGASAAEFESALNAAAKRANSESEAVYVDFSAIK